MNQTPQSLMWSRLHPEDKGIKDAEKMKSVTHTKPYPLLLIQLYSDQNVQHLKLPSDIYFGCKHTWSVHGVKTLARLMKFYNKYNGQPQKPMLYLKPHFDDKINKKQIKKWSKFPEYIVCFSVHVYL